LRLVLNNFEVKNLADCTFEIVQLATTTSIYALVIAK